MDERSLIDAAISKDLDAFNELVIKYQDAVYNQAYWLLGSHEMAEDIAQETFIKAYQKLGTFRGSSLRSWLLRIAANACLDELRRLKSHPSFSLAHTDPDGGVVETEEWLVDPGMSVESAIEQAELSSVLRRHLEALPEKHRAVVVLVDLLELDYLEAADVLQLPVGTVKSRLARARVQLKDSLSLSRLTPAIQTLNQYRSERLARPAAGSAPPHRTGDRTDEITAFELL